MHKEKPRMMIRRSGLLVSLVVSMLVLADAPLVWGAKWVTGCPKVREKLFTAGREGKTPALFAHVGHDITFRLKANRVERSGGFSTAPGGNTVSITFTPVGGDPIPLPPFAVAAQSEDTLRFPAPDTRDTLGRLVVGPAHIIVTRGETTLVDADRFPTILPPMNDVQALASASGEVEVLGAVSRKGRHLWIPVTFGGFGAGFPMPECPAEMTPLTTLAVDVSLANGEGQFLPHADFTTLKRAKLFLGDFLISGQNLYGSKLSTPLSVRRLKGKAVALCAVNDTLELVLLLRLHRSATRERSEILPLIRDGSPLRLKLQNVSAEPEIAELLGRLTRDSLKSPCLVEP